MRTAAWLFSITAKNSGSTTCLSCPLASGSEKPPRWNAQLLFTERRKRAGFLDITASEAEGRTNCYIELIQKAALENNYAARVANKGLNFAAQHRRQVFGMDAKTPGPGKEDFHPCSKSE